MVEMATIRNRGPAVNKGQWEAQIRRKGYPAQRNLRNQIRCPGLGTHYILNALKLRERRAYGTYADASHDNPWTRPIVQLAIETAMHRGEISSCARSM